METEAETAVSLICEASSQGRLVLFFGAGISRSTPAFMPTAEEIVNSILTHVSTTVPIAARPLEALAPAIRALPFESFLSVLSQCLGPRVIEFLAPLRHGKPTPRHLLMAEMLRRHLVHRVVTTNFDSLLETACVGMLDDSSVTHGATSQSISGNVWKLHGSFVDVQGMDIKNTIITTTEAITKGARSTIEQLAEVFRSSVTVFLGYSGSDTLDVVPALRIASDSSVVWVDHAAGVLVESIAPPKVSPIHLRELLRGRNRYIMRCDTDAFLAVVAHRLGVPFDGQISTTRAPERVPELEWHRPLAALTAGFLLLSCDMSSQQSAHDCLRTFLAEHESRDEYAAAASVARGQALEALGQQRAALEAYRNGRDLYNELGNVARVALTSSDIGACFGHFGEHEIALRYHQEAKEMVLECSDDSVLGIIEHNSGSALEHLGRPDEAVDAFVQATVCHERSGDLRRLANSIECLYLAALRFNVRRLLTEQAVRQMIRVLEIYWITGVNEQFVMSRTLTLCAQTFVEVYGEKAVARAREDPTLQRIDWAETVVSQIHQLKRWNRNRGFRAE